RAQRRRPRGRLRQDAAGREHPRRVRRDRPRRHRRQGSRLVGRDDRPRQGVRHRPVLHRLDQPARRGPGHDRTVVPQPRHRPYGPDFPVITVADMVRTERVFLRALGIDRLAAVAGGSLGGMQAFEWSILFPDQVDSVVAIASTPALQPQGVAWNAIARESIMRDPAWQGGRYYGTGRAPDAGMGVARMVGHITYLSALAMSDKFGRRLQFA